MERYAKSKRFQTYCDATVAIAAPVMPRRREYTRRGSRTIAERLPKPAYTCQMIAILLILRYASKEEMDK